MHSYASYLKQRASPLHCLNQSDLAFVFILCVVCFINASCSGMNHVQNGHTPLSSISARTRNGEGGCGCVLTLVTTAVPITGETQGSLRRSHLMCFPLFRIGQVCACTCNSRCPWPQPTTTYAVWFVTCVTRQGEACWFLPLKETMVSDDSRGWKCVWS